MSGTASRFQGRFGYSPGMMPGAYPARAPSMLPAMSAPPSAPAATLPAAPAAAPAAPSTPVSAGSVPMGEQGQGAPGTGFPGLGENPGTLGNFAGGPNGMGVSYGTLGGLAGMALGAATGIPGLGMVGGGIGGYADARSFNGQIADMGYEPTIDERAAAVSGATLGLAGTNPQAAFDNFMGAIGHDFGPTDAFNGATVSENTAGGGDSKGGDFGGTPGEAGVSDGMFMAGGYTGPGHPAEPAGTVHKGEHVTHARATSYYGPELLSHLNQMRIPRSKLAALAGIYSE